MESKEVRNVRVQAEEGEKEKLEKKMLKSRVSQKKFLSKKRDFNRNLSFRRMSCCPEKKSHLS